MDIFTFIIIASVVVSVLGGVLWVVFYVWLAKKAIDTVKTNSSAMGGMGSFGMPDQNFLAMLNRVQAMMQQYGNGQMNPQQLAKMQQLMNQTQIQYRQMDDLAQQKYDAQMGDLMGYAASNGLDWHP